MKNTASAAPPARNATPPHAVDPAPIALPTPPASQEKLRTIQAKPVDTISGSSPQPSPAPNTKEIPKPDHEVRAARYVLDFGMHKGKSLDQAAREDPTYFSWLKTSGFVNEQSNLGDAMTLYDRQALKALHEKYPRAHLFKFTFGIYLNKRITDVPPDYVEYLIEKKHHMWSKRPGLREALLWWDVWACLGRQNWHRRRRISKEERDAGIRGANFRRDRKKQSRQVVVW
ncbi:hypothetical protein K458DRAFT_416401 [Lentithecium fluviatile CBS 122367]|uniref:Uncharacterized protein n=1 Tax=Lentithecium fluviatile CBS 122367 TaxID=1168545 RepID=A0A6G1J6A3_9PLEO|nr:hypothetical protein K458DRAFT_416401 [Lentithecium fluviatile CBS 122367]